MIRTIIGHTCIAAGLILLPIMGGIKWDKLGLPVGLAVMAVGIGAACLLLYAGGQMLHLAEKTKRRK